MRRVSLAVFILSFAVVLYEIALTHLFAVVLQYHFVFLSVSLALCGLGLGGLAHHLKGRFAARGVDAKPEPAALAKGATAFAAAGLLALLLLLRWIFPYHVDAYWVAGLVLLVPFAFAGAFLAGAFALAPARGGALYAADLCGAALATVGTLGALALLDGVGTAILACFAGAAAALLLTETRRACIVAVAVLGVAGAMLSLRVGAHWLDVPAISASGGGEEDAGITQPLFSELAGPPDLRPVILATRWDAYARTDVTESPRNGPNRKNLYMVFTNGNVPSRMFRAIGDLRVADPRPLLRPLLDAELLAPLAYLPFAATQPERVLCLGPGGGMDVVASLLAGARHIEGAEINPAVLPLMRQFADFNGHLYERPDVHIVTAEGRSYLRSQRERYDLIYSSLTQTSVGGQAMTLMESYVYTTEAFRDYWDHLTEGGALAVVTHNPLFVLRLLATSGALLREQGMRDADIAAHVGVIGGGRAPYSLLFLLRKRPFSAAEAQMLRTFASTHGLEPIATPPLPGGDLDAVSAGRKSLAAYVAETAPHFDPGPVLLAPSTDDRPFFLDLEPGIPTPLVGLAVGTAALVLLFSLFVLLVRRQGGEAGSAPASLGLRLRFALYFSALGIGFVGVEIPLIQKLILPLGFPTLALCVTLGLLFTGAGLGSAASQRVPLARLRLTIFVAGTAVMLWLVGGLTLVPQAGWLLRASFGHRLVWIAAAILPLGFFLGMPFPSGVRLLGQVSTEDIPWMWGLNGVLSVVGSLLAAIGAKALGFRAVLVGGAALYAAIALLGTTLHGAPEPRRGAS